MESDLLPIGKVVRPHGVKGKIKVKYYGEDVAQFLQYREIFFCDGVADITTYEIAQAVSQPPFLILQLKGIETIEDIQPLVGKELLIRRNSLPHLEEDEYYWADLLGMKVRTEAGKSIGTVKEIFSTEAHDVYVIEGKRGEILLPAIHEVIKKVDLQVRVITAGWMEGLWEAEDEI